MKPIHKIAMVCTTFVLAAATGHVMQTAAPEGLHAGSARPVTAAVMPGARVHLAEVAPAPALVLPKLTVPAMRRPAAEAALGPLPQDSGVAPTGCAAPQLQAELAPGASVRLTVLAPCHGAEPAEIRHAGLRLPIRLSDDGGWSGLVPAFAEQAVFALGLPGEGTAPQVALRVPTLATVNRLAVTFAPETGLQLHGYEYGAAPGSIGDVSVALPRAADTPLGGWITSFGPPGAAQAVQIYSAPAAMSDIRLVLEAPVTPQTCGKDMAGSVLRQLGKATDQAQLSLAMPGCDDGEGAVMMPLPGFPLAVAAN
ncbi:hypothetical protein FBT96_11255 [Rhodobacter capsulatus]|uniref:Uncharacterized protein n=1 Tax=Rhodobacter capsulatus TaxID=1061 RepID=A0A4U1JQL7_RHOCA|nr:hypothetical protein [Rhodobacter capsulatus]TKD18179.1 hypothetical protein FBT96_11255 [Rhodobacter capsulatus]